MVRSPQGKRAARPKRTISRQARKTPAAKSNRRSRDGASNGVFSGLGRSEANFSPLTPISFLPRSAEIYPDRIAVIHGERRYSYRQFYERARRLASALAGAGVKRGETVSVMLPNVPAVQLAAVVARPDSRWGETPCAFVQLKPGTQATADEIIAFCRDQLAHFKAPKSVVFGPLPTTATGKVQKFTLRERARSL